MKKLLSNQVRSRERNVSPVSRPQLSSATIFYHNTVDCCLSKKKNVLQSPKCQITNPQKGGIPLHFAIQLLKADHLLDSRQVYNTLSYKLIHFALTRKIEIKQNVTDVTSIGHSGSINMTANTPQRCSSEMCPPTQLMEGLNRHVTIMAYRQEHTICLRTFHS